MLKQCANIACICEFEPVNHKQKYCSKSCQRAVRNNTTEYIKKQTSKTLDWQRRNPEKRRQAKKKFAQKMYLSGKLPNWMTDK